MPHFRKDINKLKNERRNPEILGRVGLFGLETEDGKNGMVRGGGGNYPPVGTVNSPRESPVFSLGFLEGFLS